MIEVIETLVQSPGSVHQTEQKILVGDIGSAKVGDLIIFMSRWEEETHGRRWTLASTNASRGDIDLSDEYSCRPVIMFIK